MIHLYTASTPNGHKVSCLLEALEMPYEVHSVNLAEGEQKKPEFLKISPMAESQLLLILIMMTFRSLSLVQ
jgi:glutathione S-transferase